LAGVLYLPDQHYDYRIWADVPARLGVRAVHYDRHEPMPWAGRPIPWQAADPGFPDAVRRLVPGDSFDVVVAAGEAARLAFSVASLGLAQALALFQPAPDCYLADGMPELPESEIMHAADWFLPVMEAVDETDPARRRSLVIGAWQDRYGPHLSAADLGLTGQVIGDHVEELLATSKRVAHLADAGAGLPFPELPWVDRLGEIGVPVTVVVSQRAVRLGPAIARRARDGQSILAAADTELVWLEDRDTALTTLRQVLARVT
jgi:hypothetical protein